MNAVLPKVAPKSWATIDFEAMSILRSHFPDRLLRAGKLDVLRLFDLLWDFGLEPGVEALPAGVEGMTFPDGRVLISEDVYLGAHDGLPRPRFTICHEFYHGVFHSRQLRAALLESSGVSLYRRSALKPFEDPECQANRFAASILIPSGTLAPLQRQSRSTSHLIESMCEEYGVSSQTATNFLNRKK
jgi:hypothetical protein